MVLVRRCSRGSVEVRLIALAVLRDLGQLGHAMPGECVRLEQRGKMPHVPTQLGLHCVHTLRPTRIWYVLVCIAAAPAV